MTCLLPLPLSTPYPLALLLFWWDLPRIGPTVYQEDWSKVFLQSLAHIPPMDLPTTLALAASLPLKSRYLFPPPPGYRVGPA